MGVSEWNFSPEVIVKAHEIGIGDRVIAHWVEAETQDQLGVVVGVEIQRHGNVEYTVHLDGDVSPTDGFALDRSGLGAGTIRAYLASSPTPPVEAEAVAWRAMESAPRDRTPVIIAVPTKDRDGFIVGEAYFDSESNEGGDWWWAGTSHGDYYGGPISEINYWPPTHWQPLPAPPALSPVQQEGGKP